MTQLSDLDQFADTITLPVVKHEFMSVLHKLRYPMKDIISKIYGDSLAERARRAGVSRQTVYVWLEEKFRPTGRQAKKLSSLTDVPIEHIKEYQNDAGRKVAKKAPTLAKRRKAASRGDGRVRRTVPGSKRAKRVADAQA